LTDSQIKGLKTAIPLLATILGVTPAFLYERQRALVRSGVLTPEPGRGPGSGTSFSWENVCALLAAVLLAKGLAELDLLAKPEIKLMSVAIRRSMYDRQPYSHRRDAMSGMSTLLTFSASALRAIDRLIEGREA
jgi:hypothetical protein